MPRKKAIPGSLKRCLVLIALLPITLAISDCTNAPKFPGPIYQGWPDWEAIRRCLTEDPDKPCDEWEEIKASDPAFQGYTCVRTEDLVEYRKEILRSCKEWE